MDESVQTSAPVEFEVHGTNLTEVPGDEVVETNLAAYKWSAIYFGASLKESVDTILEKEAQECVKTMNKEVAGLRERFSRTLQESKEKLQQEKSVVSGSGMSHK